LRYLLDTHTLLWITQDSDQLAPKVKKIFLDEKNEILLSTISLWEIAIKISLEKLKLPSNLDEFIKNHIIRNGIKIVNFEANHICQLENLPFHHRDPFDRALAAYCIQEKIPLLTKDKIFKKYKIKSIW